MHYVTRGAAMGLISSFTSLPMVVVSVVRIWDTVGTDQVLKAEYKVLGGKMYVLLIVRGYHTYLT